MCRETTAAPAAWHGEPAAPPPENGAVDPAGEARSVVWWRQPTPTPTIHVHHIGWVDISGRPHGRLEISSHHIRLDERSIHTALADHLVPAAYPSVPTIRPAHRAPARDLSLEAGLIIDGHSVTHLDLLTHYGLDVVAGVSAQLLVRGPQAAIALEETLRSPTRDAVIATIRHSLREFATATPIELFDKGWQPRRDDRWQLILTQA